MSLWFCISMDFISPSSSSSTTCYDAFVSFRGEDTRMGFAAHLHKDLEVKGISCFKDDEKLRRGKSISPELLKAIENSRFSIVVISENYASSSWCLEELVKIIESKEALGHSILPIFYNVNPSDVKSQSGSFAVSFANHEKDPHKAKQLQKWREALTKVATIAGWDTRNRPETIIIEEVAQVILEELHRTSSSNFDHLVGIYSRVDEIQQLLMDESMGVCLIGIWGMGGIGKTTAVEALFHKISWRFKASYFLANVRESSKKGTVVALRDEMLSVILEEKGLKIGTFNLLPDIIKVRLRKRKVLIVLDDVNDLNQLNILIGNCDWFGSGSRIIVTARDKQVLIGKATKIYEAKGLDYHEALKLFCLNAFKQSHPLKDYVDLSKRVVDYAQGVPLALKVLGSLLYGKNREDWESALQKLRGYSNLEIQNTLKLSYDELSKTEKDIFLDIACFFKGRNRDWVESILDGCDFCARFGISRLIDKCLIIEKFETLEMHDLVQEMGWDIVMQQPIDRQSRFWIPEDIHYVLTCNMGSEAIEGLVLDKVSEVGQIDLSPNIFSRMYNLRLLKFYDDNYGQSHLISELSVQNGLQYLPSKLSYLHWDGYPWKSLPSGFSPGNLVELFMPFSRIEQLWSGVKHARKLRRIYLRYSKHLTTLPNLSSAANLEWIDLYGCESLLDISSFSRPFNNLNCLNVANCKMLRSLPDLSWAPNLESIILDGCHSLHEIPSSIRCLQKLTYLSLSTCIELNNLPSFLQLTSLRHLDISYCSGLKKFPEVPENIEKLFFDGIRFEECPPSIQLNCFETLDFNCYFNVKRLPKISGNIKYLNLSRSAIEEVPSSIGDLTFLIELNLEGCQKLESLPNTICFLQRLERLNLSGCSAMKELPSSICSLCSLTVLDISHCCILVLPAGLGCLISLQYLYMRGNNFDRIPESIEHLLKLKVLDLRCCKKLQYLPELPCQIVQLLADDCASLETVSSLITALIELPQPKEIFVPTFSFANCLKLDHNARSIIMAGTQLRIQHTPDTLLELSTRRKYVPISFMVCLPGSEIPQWFSYQSMGYFLNSKFPQGWRTKFMGLAVSAVLQFEGDFEINSDAFYVECKCHFKAYGDDNSLDFILHLETCVNKYVSDHVLIYYENEYGSRDNSAHGWLSKRWCDIYEASFEFSTSPNFRVKRCGAELVYIQDENQSKCILS